MYIDAKTIGNESSHSYTTHYARANTNASTGYADGGGNKNILWKNL